jgi:hypothetical protein
MVRQNYRNGCWTTVMTQTHSGVGFASIATLD